MILSRSNPSSGLAATFGVSALAFALVIRACRIGLVRTTLPSSSPQTSPGWLRARRILDAATDIFVAFDHATKTPDPRRTVIVPHAHFRERFIGYPRSAQIRGRVVWMASTESERNAMASLSPPAELLDVSCASDGALVQQITASELVVVPRPESLADLQVLFLALSLDRPVLTRKDEAMVSLAESVGPGWLILDQEPAAAETVTAATVSVRSTERPARPDLDAHDPRVVQAAYGEAYKSAFRRRGKRYRSRHL